MDSVDIFANAVACAWHLIHFNPFSKTKSAARSNKISLSYKAILIALLGGFGKLLSCLEIGSTVLKMSSWSLYGLVFDFSKSRDTVLLRVGNCSMSFVGSFAELFNLGVVVWYKIDSFLDPFLRRGFSKLITYMIFSNASLSR